MPSIDVTIVPFDGNIIDEPGGSFKSPDSTRIRLISDEATRGGDSPLSFSRIRSWRTLLPVHRINIFFLAMVLALSLSGCTELSGLMRQAASPPQGALRIDCSLPAKGWSSCRKRASDICPMGYRVTDITHLPESVRSGERDGDYYGQALSRHMTVVCR